MSTTISIRIEKKLANIIEEISKKERMDKSSVIRRFLTKAAKEWLINQTLQNYKQGKFTLWQAAEKSNLSLWETINKKREIHTPYTLKALKEDLKGTQKL